MKARRLAWTGLGVLLATAGALLQTPVPPPRQTGIAALLPAGATLVLQARDFGSLVGDWSSSAEKNEVAREPQLPGVRAIAAVFAPEGRLRRVRDGSWRAAGHGAGVRRGGHRVGARAVRHREAGVPVRHAAAVGKSDGERVVADPRQL